MMYFLRAPLVWLRWFIWDMHYNMVYDFIINTPSITIEAQVEAHIEQVADSAGGRK